MFVIVLLATVVFWLWLFDALVLKKYYTSFGWRNCFPENSIWNTAVPLLSYSCMFQVEICFINWTLRMSDNLPERVQILGHAHILCITIWENRIICCQIFCDLLLKSAFERIFNVMQLILVQIKWHIKWQYLIQTFHDICLSYYFKLMMIIIRGLTVLFYGLLVQKYLFLLNMKYLQVKRQLLKKIKNGCQYYNIKYFNIWLAPINKLEKHRIMIMSIIKNISL